MGGIHGGFPQLLRVHFAQTFIALNGIVLFASGQAAQLLIVIGILLRAGALDQIQRRHADIHMPLSHQLTHIAIKEGKQNRADMRAVLIGVGQNDDLVILQRADIKILVNVGAQRRNNGAEFLIGQHLIQALLFGVEGLAAQRQDGLKMPVAPLLGAAASRIALYDK